MRLVKDALGLELNVVDALGVDYLDNKIGHLDKQALAHFINAFAKHILSLINAHVILVVPIQSGQGEHGSIPLCSKRKLETKRYM